MRNWAYLATAPNQAVAEMWRDMLVKEGIPATIHPDDTLSYIGVSFRPVRVLVAEDKVDAAKELFAEWEEEDSESASNEEEEADDSADN